MAAVDGLCLAHRVETMFTKLGDMLTALCNTVLTASLLQAWSVMWWMQQMLLLVCAAATHVGYVCVSSNNNNEEQQGITAVSLCIINDGSPSEKKQQSRGVCVCVLSGPYRMCAKPSS